ncbi:MAG: DUF554 domain-containing protein [Deltaproteobacteria bacterium]|jgi:uncharacterized membrane protein YqgA involved in biofilm formation|nr:DUF554 domain-containing protein [Deltaproteobacteria bacterium]
MVGTTINVGTILAGSMLGVTIGSRLSEKMRETALQGLGLVTTLVGLQMALETKNILIVLGAVLTGAILGEMLRIDEGLQKLGTFLQSSLSKGTKGQTARNFSEGFVMASLVFCVGPMAILGSIQDGLSGDYRTLAVKSMLDFFAAIAFSSSLGWGVGLSAFTILIYQGSLTFFAGVFAGILTDPMIAEMTATGGLIIVGIGLKLLDLKAIRLANFLPALAMAPILVAVVPIIKSLF